MEGFNIKWQNRGLRFQQVGFQNQRSRSSIQRERARKLPRHNFFDGNVIKQAKRCGSRSFRSLQSIIHSPRTEQQRIINRNLPNSFAKAHGHLWRPPQTRSSLRASSDGRIKSCFSSLFAGECPQ